MAKNSLGFVLLSFHLYIAGPFEAPEVSTDLYECVSCPQLSVVNASSLRMTVSCALVSRWHNAFVIVFLCVWRHNELDYYPLQSPMTLCPVESMQYFSIFDIIFHFPVVVVFSPISARRLAILTWKLFWTRYGRFCATRIAQESSVTLCHYLKTSCQVEFTNVFIRSMVCFTHFNYKLCF